MRILLFGLGSIGSRHLANLRALRPDAQVVAADPDEAARERAGIPAYADWRLALAREWPEAVIIASPTRYHLEQLEKCLAAGIPALVEKPACLPGEAERLAGLAADKQLAASRSAVGFCYRFHPAVERLRGQLERSARPEACLEFLAQDDLMGKYGPTVAETMGSHSLDMARWMLGEVEYMALRTDGRVMRGLVRHSSGGTSLYTLRINAGPRRSYIMNDKGLYELHPDDGMYRRELAAWLDCAVGLGRDARLATLGDGAAVSGALARCQGF